ncbi:hypothetical protein KSF78_0009307 [Schistosoma japonicum]|nr:hypothetical protein KSF78_0009307 [Schistosoma japonicum]
MTKWYIVTPNLQMFLGMGHPCLSVLTDNKLTSKYSNLPLKIKSSRLTGEAKDNLNVVFKILRTVNMHLNVCDVLRFSCFIYHTLYLHFQIDCG